jgi:lipopolysaccharide biosynthesis regulator YciM
MNSLLRLTFLCFCTLALTAQEWKISSEELLEEALYLRRIADFWEEGELALAKGQIEEFILKFPEHESTDLLKISLGNLAFQEKNYETALQIYDTIQLDELLPEVRPLKAEVLYHLGRYEELIALGSSTNLTENYFIAMALYHQLRASPSEEIAQKTLAQLNQLLGTEFEQEILYPLSQLYSYLRQDEKGAEILFMGAEKYVETKDTFLFEAALLQLHFDPGKALTTLQQLIHHDHPKKQEAVYQLLKTLFEQKNHSLFLETQKELFEILSIEDQKEISLHVAQSLMELHLYPEAIQQLQRYLTDLENPDSSTALSLLMETFYLSDDLGHLEETLQQLAELPSNQDTLSKIATGRFFRSLLLKKQGALELARQEMEILIGEPIDFPGKAQATFELAHLDYQNQKWASCREKIAQFLSTFEHHELTPFGWHYLIASSIELTTQEPENTLLKEQLISDLQMLLKKNQDLKEEDRIHWVLLQAKMQIELKSYQAAIDALQSLNNPDANTDLLLAICYRDQNQDWETFCNLTESGIKEGGTIIPLETAHLSLFNAYLQRSDPEKASHHLYQAFTLQAPISQKNLLWLGNQFITSDPEKAFSIFSFLSDQAENDPLLLENCLYHLIASSKSQEFPLPYAPVSQKLIHLYEQHPDLSWNFRKEAELLLGEAYLENGEVEKAVLLFQTMTENAKTFHNKPYLQALLHLSKLKVRQIQGDHNHPEFVQTAADLKWIILQKTLQYEPIHWEATMAYLDLLAPSSQEKRLHLLQKIKHDFENPQDLLSQDYLKGKERFPLQYQTHLNYIKMIDDEIEALQNQSATRPPEASLAP